VSTSVIADVADRHDMKGRSGITSPQELGHVLDDDVELAIIPHADLSLTFPSGERRIRATFILGTPF
jgi:hypothetical protein